MLSEVLQRSASKSTRISKQSVQQILKSDLNLYLYKMTVVPNLQFTTNIKNGIC